MIGHLIAAAERADVLSQSRKLGIKLIMHSVGIRVEGRYLARPDCLPFDYQIELKWMQIMATEEALIAAIDLVHGVLERRWRSEGG